MSIAHFPKFSHKTKVWIIVFIVSLLGYKIFQGGRDTEADSLDNAAEKAALTITTAQPKLMSMPISLRANGNIVPWQEAIVGAEVNGLRLSNVQANVGDVVTKGQVLATFASETNQAEALQARAQSMEALAAYENAKADAARARNIEKTEALSKQQLDHYFTLEKTALARYEAAQAMYQSAQLRLAQTQVKAPDQGVISARNATMGAVVGAGQELFRIIRQSRLEWRAEVTADEVIRVKKNATVRVTAAGDTVLKGVVRAISPSADPMTRNLLIYVDLPEHAAVKAGTFASGVIHLGQKEGLTVPQQALVIRDGFTYVFVMDDKHQVTQRKVRAGLRAGDHVEILEGIQTKEQVAVQGAGFLNDGDRVKVVN